MLESAITAKIRKALRARGIWAVKIHGSAEQESGLSDLVCCVPIAISVGQLREQLARHADSDMVCIGQFVSLEVKRPGLTATPLQEFVLQELRTYGAWTGVVHSVEEAIDAIAETNLRVYRDGRSAE